ncbi:MAG: D-alanyl-D-alanine carboxypeptidase [Lachnospiraceae bacterium]|nr:D-alanyl-D-alanine carboxypeptidase [Lachnospiraceae bacterium]
MKCTNKRSRITAILFLACLLLGGCNGNQLPMAYDPEVNVSAYRFEKSSSSAGEEGKASPFAEQLCLQDEETLPTGAVDLSEALSGVLCDINGKRIVYAKDENLQLAPASLTKVLTALVALKHGELDMVLTASENVKINESGATLLGLEPGDKMTLDQALHALLMQSANDVAVMIAENIGGSEEAFCEMMNAEAKALGATNSNFKNPHGLTQDDHYSCAYDMYLIFQEVMKYSEFTQIIHQDAYETIYYDAEGNAKEYSCATTNLFLRGDYTPPEGISVVGGKTGTTAAARNCLILLSKDSSGNPYVSVILNCSERQYLYQEMTGLLDQI